MGKSTRRISFFPSQTLGEMRAIFGLHHRECENHKTSITESEKEEEKGKEILAKSAVRKSQNGRSAPRFLLFLLLFMCGSC